MRHSVRLIVAALACTATLSPAVAERTADDFFSGLFASVDGERTIGGVAVEKRAEQTHLLHQLLVETQVTKGLGQAFVVEVSASEAAAIGASDLFEKRYRVGLAKPVSATIDLAAKSATFGAVAARVDGTLVWSGVVRSPGAKALRLEFARFDLPAGVELYVYSNDGQAYGPYVRRGPAGSGELVTNSIFGDEAILQLRANPSVGADKLAAARLELTGVGYLGNRLLINGGGDLSKDFCSYNETCVENAGCYSVSAVNTARDAVAHILFRSGGSYYICTGGLINDSDAGTQIPYFLTANHCLSTSTEASSLETYFFYETSCSSPNCDAPYAGGGTRTPHTLGSTVMAQNATSDYTLLRLSGNAPSGSAFLGWNSTPVANSNGTTLHRISHPSGAPQAYSAQTVDTGAGTCRTWPRGDWIYSTETVGATEGGSSGSPVVNGSGQIVGQLSGGCGTNVSDVCDNQNNATVDGAFAAYFSEVESILTGGGGGGPTCAAKGASCSANSECCSNKCAGKSGRKTCK